MSDYIVRATAANSQIRAFAAVTTDMVETARKNHNTSPVATAALGRLLTGGAMMGAMMKGEKDLLTLRIHAGGPLQGITVTADSHGNVKGYVGNPDVCIPANSKGKLDVAGAVGVGFMDVIKDMGLKEPYVGQVALQTSEIAEDLTYYFATSEQVPSAVGLGVLMNKDNTVRQAGGFIVQLMPFAEEEVIAKLEENVSKIDSVTNLLEQGHTPESLLEKVLEGFDIEINDTLPTQFHCNCCRERVEKALISIGRKELNEMIQEGKDIEMNCHFCNKNYNFTVEDLKRIIRECKRGHLGVCVTVLYLYCTGGAVYHCCADTVQSVTNRRICDGFDGWFCTWRSCKHYSGSDHDLCTGLGCGRRSYSDRDRKCLYRYFLCMVSY